ncbi:Hypothetical predicted protein [Paramuricea clavata]|uniref:Uncharacterized protein n=1 Tax=Paramuricea clavata TaxID=317549 RepID=A0A6S7K1J6_PARCT|nr:Hypothetical predicted protein [Paramuricea clavata]
MKSASYQLYVHLNQVTVKHADYATVTVAVKQAREVVVNMRLLFYTAFWTLPTEHAKHSSRTYMYAASPEVEFSSWLLQDFGYSCKVWGALFEKTDVKKQTNKRYVVKGDRENYCAIPPFAQTVTDEEIKSMADAFKNADQASLFCKTLESNAYKPFEVFETSCSQQKRKHQQDESPPSQTLESLLIEKLFQNVPKDYHPPANYNQQQLELVERTVGLTISSTKEICLNTMEQSKNPQWYPERV